MSSLLNTTTYTATEARDKLFSLVKTASKGLRVFEIKLRGSDPVVLINKADLESWQETLDILSNPKEVKAIRQARKEKRTIPFKKVLKEAGLNEDSI